MESFEGGIHTPMIVFGAGLKTKKGSQSGALSHAFDIMPTILDLTNTAYPEKYNGYQLTALDGKSFLPVLQAKTTKGREDIYFEHATGKAYLKGDWKLVQKTQTQTWDLYNLASDKNETNNLAEQEPERVLELKNSWENWYNTMKPYIKPRQGSGPR